MIQNMHPFEIGVYIVDTKVDMKVKLQSAGVFVDAPVFAGGFKKLLSVSSIE